MDLVLGSSEERGQSSETWEYLSISLKKEELHSSKLLHVWKIYYSLQQQKVKSMKCITTITELLVVWSVCRCTEFLRLWLLMQCFTLLPLMLQEVAELLQIIGEFHFSKVDLTLSLSHINFMLGGITSSGSLSAYA